MQRKEEIKITPEILATLQAHRRRTKVGPTKLFYKKKYPKGLTPALVVGWLEKKVKSASKAHLDYVMQQWEILPSHKNKKIKPYRKNRPAVKYEYVPITPEIRAKLRDYRDRARLFPRHILKDATDKPKGLNIDIISSFYRDSRKSARIDMLEWVLDKCKELDETAIKYEQTDEIEDRVSHARKAFNIFCDKYVQAVAKGKQRQWRKEVIAYVELMADDAESVAKKIKR